MKRHMFITSAYVVVALGCAPVVSAPPQTQTSIVTLQPSPRPTMLPPQNIGQFQPVSEDLSKRDFEALQGLSRDSDESEVLSSNLVKEFDKLTSLELSSAGLATNDIAVAKTESPVAFTRLWSNDALLPVLNPDVLKNGFRVYFAQTIDFSDGSSESSNEAFSGSPYTRDDFIGVSKKALVTLTEMTDLPVAYTDGKENANLVIGFSRSAFKKLGAETAYGYSNVDEGGFEMRQSEAIGQYLSVKGNLVLLNPINYAKEYRPKISILFGDDGKKALFMHEMYVVALQEIIHAAGYAGGFTRMGLGHTDNILSVMYSGTGDAHIEKDVRIKDASESLDPSEQLLLDRGATRLVVRSRLAPPRLDPASIFIRAIRLIAAKL